MGVTLSAKTTAVLDRAMSDGTFDCKDAVELRAAIKKDKVSEKELGDVIAARFGSDALISYIDAAFTAEKAGGRCPVPGPKLADAFALPVPTAGVDLTPPRAPAKKPPPVDRPAGPSTGVTTVAPPWGSATPAPKAEAPKVPPPAVRAAIRLVAADGLSGDDATALRTLGREHGLNVMDMAAAIRAASGEQAAQDFLGHYPSGLPDAVHAKVIAALADGIISKEEAKGIFAACAANNVMPLALTAELEDLAGKGAIKQYFDGVRP